MDVCVDLFFSDVFKDVVTPRVRRYLRDHSNPLEIPDDKFLQWFRLNKNAFKYILEELQTFLPFGKRTSSVPPILKLAALLKFLAEGDYQKECGNDSYIGLAQSSISKMTSEVISTFEKHICPKWIKPLNVNEKEEARRYFYDKYKFPGVVGCLDGTHIRIFPPRKNLKKLYMNKKGFYTLNVLIVCDHKMRIQYVNAEYPGSHTDSFVWNNCDFKEEFLRCNDDNAWLLGDANYSLEPCVMTPYPLAETHCFLEMNYNLIHGEARNIVEKTIGLLKNRFRCLLSERALYYKPEKATKIVNVCCALHNIAEFFNADDPFEENIEDEDSFIEDLTFDDESPDFERARRIRDEIKMTLINYEKKSK